MYCPNCGEEVFSNFCTRCGYDIKSVTHSQSNTLSSSHHTKRKRNRILISIFLFLIIAGLTVFCLFFYPVRPIKVPNAFNPQTEVIIEDFTFDDDLLIFVQDMVTSFNKRNDGLGLLYSNGERNSDLAKKYDDLKTVYNVDYILHYRTANTEDFRFIVKDCLECYEQINYLEASAVRRWSSDGSGQLSKLSNVTADRDTVIQAREILAELIDKYFE